MHVLLDDDLGRLTVRRLRPWHRWLARGLAARLDHQLAEGTRPESSAILAYLFRNRSCWHRVPMPRPRRSHHMPPRSAIAEHRSQWPAVK